MVKIPLSCVTRISLPDFVSCYSIKPSNHDSITVIAIEITEESQAHQLFLTKHRVAHQEWIVCSLPFWLHGIGFLAFRHLVYLLYRLAAGAFNTCQAFIKLHLGNLSEVQLFLGLGAGGRAGL